MRDEPGNQSRYLVTREAMRTHLVEDRRAEVSPWGLGNSKIGPGVLTYSKSPGRKHSCPGSTDFCERICYAKRIPENPHLGLLYASNDARGYDLPELPSYAKLVRGHISGDFDSIPYVHNWTRLAECRPEVLFWFYTRVWRVPTMLRALEDLRALPNVQLWASMDVDCGNPPKGWRVAWIEGDERIGEQVAKHAYRSTKSGAVAIVCPEETGKKKNCEACGYCFKPGITGDLVFLEH